MRDAGEPHVSVCIRAYRRPDGLAAAIESVLTQSYRDFEVVVSDDGGDLEEVAASFHDARVRYFRNETPLGPAVNLRQAVDRSRGRLLAFHSDDDLWLPGFLSNTVAVL